MDSSYNSSHVTSESSSSSNNKNGEKQRIIDELTRGRDVTDQLRAILKNGDDDSSASLLSAADLVQKILDSFADSISIVHMMSTTAADSDEVSQTPGRKSEVSGDSCNILAPAKDRRGCYKRRRCTETETRESPTPFEDGHAWRKYGQKVIHKATHPRNYFRCTHKYDQGCQATKQVQKIQDDPPLFRNTYHSHHTCKNLIINDKSHIIMDAAPQDHYSSVIWSFGSSKNGDNNVPTNYGPVPVVINPVPAVKRKGEELFNYLTKSKSSLSNDHYADHDYNNFIGVAHDDQFLTYVEGHESVPPRAYSSGSDHYCDVYSCTASTRSMDMASILSFDELPL